MAYPVASPNWVLHSPKATTCKNGAFSFHPIIRRSVAMSAAAFSLEAVPAAPADISSRQWHPRL
jgi:hypothetical protein